MAELQALKPPPLCADFEKETWDNVIRKRNEQIFTSIKEVPATFTGKMFWQCIVERMVTTW